MEQKKISKAVLKRLPGYLAYLKSQIAGKPFQNSLGDLLL